MVQIERRNTSLRAGRRPRRRLLAACAIILGTLAVAAPSWAGPMMGC